MTAPRSFREAFTEDPADVKDRARLVAERDSARDWAVALENRLAKIEDLCNDEREWNNNRNLEVACFARDIRAALTGGEDDARA